MPAFGSITFDGVSGIVIPRSVPVVEDIPNPGLVDAVLELDVGQRSTLRYDGFFPAASVAATLAAIWASVSGAAISAEDETGAVYTVKVCSVEPRATRGLCGGVAGRWITLSAEVRPWV